jgi:type 1 fimbriae regulatory protein FimB/type 1 fimbriae regulatory protein FimE
MSNISNLEDYRTPTPNTENSKVTKTRKYKDVSEREYLTSSEIEGISKVAKSIGRHGHRDSTIIMIAYHHALRVSELVNLNTWWFVRGGHMTMVTYHMVYRADCQSRQDAIYHLSYLAKTRGEVIALYKLRIRY